MKLLRVGEKGKEIVAALDKNQKFRDLSSKIDDLNPETLNLKVLQSLQDTELENCKEIKEVLGGDTIESYIKLKRLEIENFDREEVFDKKKPVTEWEKNSTLDC